MRYCTRVGMAPWLSELRRRIRDIVQGQGTACRLHSITSTAVALDCLPLEVRIIRRRTLGQRQDVRYKCFACGSIPHGSSGTIDAGPRIQLVVPSNRTKFPVGCMFAWCSIALILSIGPGCATKSLSSTITPRTKQQQQQHC